MRPFDWYTVADKKQAVQELQAEYWAGWRVLVQHYRRIGKPNEANQLLSEMQQRLSRLQDDPSSKLFWPAAAILLELYSQGRQPEKIRETLAQIEASRGAGTDRKGMGKLSQLKIRYGLK